MIFGSIFLLHGINQKTFGGSSKNCLKVNVRITRKKRRTLIRGYSKAKWKSFINFCRDFCPFFVGFWSISGPFYVPSKPLFQFQDCFFLPKFVPFQVNFRSILHLIQVHLVHFQSIFGSLYVHFQSTFCQFQFIFSSF